MDSNTFFPVRDFDLAATLNCGQAFRWTQHGDAWEGVVCGRWVRLRQSGFLPSGVGALDSSKPNVECAPVSSCSVIEATTAVSQPHWHWLAGYLRLDDDFDAIRETFPGDTPMRAALSHTHGLRLLRQEPWECLASFILSSTKQISQIRQCIAQLCDRYGELVETNRGVAGGTNVSGDHAFPSAARLASATEAELRACKIGFRAKYLRTAAQRVASGELDFSRIQGVPLDAARAELMSSPGVGPKIADCVLLFSCGFDAAFPIDVWVERALRQLYFPGRRVKRARIERFAATHFGPHAGYAQQYLFHYLRTGNAHGRRVEETKTPRKYRAPASSRRE